MKIEIGEHCFGVITRIDGKDLYDENQDIDTSICNTIFGKLSEISLNKDSFQELMFILCNFPNKLTLSDEEFGTFDIKDNNGPCELMCVKIGYDQNILIDELKDNQNSINEYDWHTLLSLIVTHNEILTIDSSTKSCDQCGNYNSRTSYVLE